MKGNNSIAFCDAQLIEMVQHYFDNEMFRGGQSPTITSLARDGSQNITRFQVSDVPRNQEQPLLEEKAK